MTPRIDVMAGARDTGDKPRFGAAAETARGRHKRQSGWRQRSQPHPQPAQAQAAAGAAPDAALVSELIELARARSSVEAQQAAARVRAKVAADQTRAYLPLVDVLLSRTHELERLGRLAGSDELTGIANRRTFNDTLRRELSRASRDQRPLALLLLDLDGLKAINDGLGHAEGDRALRILARCASEAVRHGDLVARIGGDEFAVLLPNTDAAAARAVALRIRERLAGLSRAKPDLLVRASIGIAVADSRTSRMELLANADAALYRDKLARR